MLSKIHLAATGLLLVAAVTFGGLWLRGRARPEASPEAPSTDDPGGRYRIEKVDDARRVIDGAGSLGFFGANVLEAWAFKYSGGYLQVQLVTDFNGSVAPGDWLPPDWPSRLASNGGARENQAAAFRKEGYVLLTAMPSAMTAEELFHLYAPQLCGALGSGLTGPFHALFPLHLQALHKRPYRLFLSAGPRPGDPGSGFKDWAEYLLPIREPVVPRDLASEGGHVGGGKNLEAGKDITLLDRTRGNSRVRLKARFLGDGEVRDFATKTGN
jgi:hypothetical protein